MDHAFLRSDRLRSRPHLSAAAASTTLSASSSAFWSCGARQSEDAIPLARRIHFRRLYPTRSPNQTLAAMDLRLWPIRGMRQVRVVDDNDKGTATTLNAAYESLPTPPATPDAPLAAAVRSAGPNDRISSLPNQILQNISPPRTPCTPARSPNPLWRPGLEQSFDVYNAVTDLLDTHPGPFRCFQITCCYMKLNRDNIEEWLELIATKEVKELAFINRPWPLHIPLPATLFSCTSLTRLHIGAWRIPDTAALPKATSFPHLQELFLSLIAMKDRDIAFLSSTRALSWRFSPSSQARPMCASAWLATACGACSWACLPWETLPWQTLLTWRGSFC
ncbi:hypothetical protein PR202_gb00686 [Eleusine coracana subsp. coracana]|uniref:F-box/LRR-repeat protein 15/At3g58940/PEG3-like LRR domain-containing protein n=1 Tax=Eleusine coracana subsp. coracana TaxID=191504 RepID=A0AAV5DUE1_ELECO|nr:hypothetical protein PR202_gb00686 [Eleusine coracana subsp. coracana]